MFWKIMDAISLILDHFMPGADAPVQAITFGKVSEIDLSMAA